MKKGNQKKRNDKLTSLSYYDLIINIIITTQLLSIRLHTNRIDSNRPRQLFELYNHFHLEPLHYNPSICFIFICSYLFSIFNSFLSYSPRCVSEFIAIHRQCTPANRTRSAPQSLGKLSYHITCTYVYDTRR